jgi:hypothetical protein
VLVRTCERFQRIVDDLDVLEVALREARELIGRKRARGRRSRRHEPRPGSTKLSQHRVGVLVGEIETTSVWSHAGVGRRWRTVGIVRTVRISPPRCSKRPGSSTLRCRDRVADERLAA